jgi:hypothetical protein
MKIPARRLNQFKDGINSEELQIDTKTKLKINYLSNELTIVDIISGSILHTYSSAETIKRLVKKDLIAKALVNYKIACK